MRVAASPFSLRDAARERGDAVALVSATESITYADLWRRVLPVVHLLRAEVAPVAVVATLRLETLLAIYALVELGLPVVPIHPRLQPAERAALVELAGAGRVLDETWTPPDAATSVSGERESAEDGMSEEEPLAILFTSGSSGTPKAVVLSRRAFRASAVASAENLGWQPDDRWLLCMPLAHVGGLSVVLRCLAARVPIVLSPWTGAVAPLLRDTGELRATLLSLVPTMLSRILDETRGAPFPAHVRAVLLGGDAASPTLLGAAAARGVPVLTTYGMTETCSQIATLSPISLGEACSVERGVGRPLRGIDLRIVDGEIQVRGPMLFTRYLRGAASPFSPDGWFSTGDLGRLDETGHLHVSGRRSDLVITGGENVDPREVEIALEACAGVRAACVFPVADERWGQIVAAAIVVDPQATLDTILELLSRALAKHKRPRLIAVCPELVYNATGKLDRAGTAALAAPKLIAVRGVGSRSS